MKDKLEIHSREIDLYVCRCSSNYTKRWHGVEYEKLKLLPFPEGKESPVLENGYIKNWTPG